MFLSSQASERESFAASATVGSLIGEKLPKALEKDERQGCSGSFLSGPDGEMLNFCFGSVVVFCGF